MNDNGTVTLTRSDSDNGVPSGSITVATPTVTESKGKVCVDRSGFLRGPEVPDTSVVDCITKTYEWELADGDTRATYDIRVFHDKENEGKEYLLQREIRNNGLQMVDCGSITLSSEGESFALGTTVFKIVPDNWPGGASYSLWPDSVRTLLGRYGQVHRNVEALPYRHSSDGGLSDEARLLAAAALEEMKCNLTGRVFIPELKRQLLLKSTE